MAEEPKDTPTTPVEIDDEAKLDKVTGGVQSDPSPPVTRPQFTPRKIIQPD